MFIENFKVKLRLVLLASVLSLDTDSVRAMESSLYDDEWKVDPVLIQALTLDNAIDFMRSELPKFHPILKDASIYPIIASFIKEVEDFYSIRSSFGDADAAALKKILERHDAHVRFQ